MMRAITMPALGRRETGALILLFFAAFAGFLLLFNRFPVLHDADSYFQLAVARLYAENGVRPDLEWARFSIMREGFGDKDFLFHLLLVPFAVWMDPLAGGRIALALLNAALATLLAWGAFRVAGFWALAVPLWVYLTAIPLFFRLNRLRPEAFALLILLAATYLAASRRHRLLGVAALVFALSYTAWQALLGLCGLWFVAERWRTGRWSPALFLYPLLGVGLGSIIHPQFPANVTVWVHQNILLPFYGSGLDVGSEFVSITTRQLLLSNLGWWLGLLVIWRSCEQRSVPNEGQRKALFFGVAAGAFGVLYLLVDRFSTFFLPFATLALFAEIERRSWRLSHWTRLPWRGRVPFALVFSATMLLGLPETISTVGRMLSSGDTTIPLEVDREAFGASVPRGAKVAATWGAAEWYTFFAPQGSYLNVLDPIFMAIPYPEEHRAQLSVFGNREPDVPLLVKTRLDSDFIAVDRFNEPAALADRLVVDPRIRVRYGGYHLLAEVLPDANRAFVLDWRLLRPDIPLPPPAAGLEDSPSYPRLKKGSGRRFEGYVDGRRLGKPRGCIAFVHQLSLAARTGFCLEFAPAGPSSLWVDDELHLRSLLGKGAALGSGFLLEETLEPGDHLLTVETCATSSEPAQLGFYLLERDRISLEDEDATITGGTDASPCGGVPLRPGAPLTPAAAAAAPSKNR
jgi:hypothetical protein